MAWRDLACRISCWPPLSRLIGSRRPSVLLYHGVPRYPEVGEVHAQVFEQHILWLKKHVHVIAHTSLGAKRPWLGRPQVILTFDDGFRNNAEVVAPILRRHNVPGIFFISSGHSEKGKYLWFRYLRAMKRWFQGNGFNFAGQFWDMSPEHRDSTVSRLSEALLEMKPHPSAMYEAIEKELPRLEDFVSPEDINNSCAGMTSEQVGELAADPLFTVGVHTVNHPFLTMCEPDVCRQELEQNKAWLEKACGMKCNTVSYPIGDYDSVTLRICREMGLGPGYAVIPRAVGYPDLEVSRVGIYSTSTGILAFKATFANNLRFLKLRVG